MLARKDNQYDCKFEWYIIKRLKNQSWIVQSNNNILKGEWNMFQVVNYVVLSSKKKYKWNLWIDGNEPKIFEVIIQLIDF